MTPQPRRIQRKRTRGWKMPDNTVYVGRPTKWGNRWRIGENEAPTAALAVEWYKSDLLDSPFGAVYNITVDDVIKELHGKNLACWCPLDQPCHADVLLALANQSGV